MIRRGFRYRLQPTEEQEKQFRSFSGVCRLVYNLALEQRRDWWQQYQATTGRSLNWAAQSREVTALRADFDWIAAVPRPCLEQALRDLERAYQSFYRREAGYPTPRKKGVNDTFRFQGRDIRTRKLNAKWSEVYLPKIGWVRYRDTRSLLGTIVNIAVSWAPNGWHVSFALAIEHDLPECNKSMIGIDRGIVNTISLSSGERFSLPARLETLSRQRRQVQRAMSRRKRGSRRYVSARRRAVNIASRIGRVRKDWQHRSTTGLAKRFGVIVLEDLNTKGMTASARGTIEKPGKNVRQKAGLDRSILNQGWYIFETLLTYKLEERGGRLIKVDPAYTSQTCFECGTVDKESRESQASFHCRHCGHRDHADINAAKNILRRSTAFMDVEEGHWFSCEASTGGSVAPVNPTAHVVGGC